MPTAIYPSPYILRAKFTLSRALYRHKVLSYEQPEFAAEAARAWLSELIILASVPVDRPEKKRVGRGKYDRKKIVADTDSAG